MYVPDEGSLLPKYRDCTTYNDFDLYIYIYIYIYVCIYIHIHINSHPRGSRAHIITASMKKSPRWRFLSVFELSENMRICLDQTLQHFDRRLLKFGV